MFLTLTLVGVNTLASVMAAEAKTTTSADAAFAAKQMGDNVTMPDWFTPYEYDSEGYYYDATPTTFPFKIGPFGPRWECPDGITEMYTTACSRSVLLVQSGGIPKEHVTTQSSWETYRNAMKDVFRRVCIESLEGQRIHVEIDADIAHPRLEDWGDYTYYLNKGVDRYTEEHFMNLFTPWATILDGMMILMDPASSDEEFDAVCDGFIDGTGTMQQFHSVLYEYVQVDICELGDQFANIIPPEQIKGTYPQVAFSLILDATMEKLQEEFHDEDTVNELMALFTAAHDIRMKMTLFGAMDGERRLVSDLRSACAAWRSRLVELRALHAASE